MKNPFSSSNEKKIFSKLFSKDESYYFRFQSWEICEEKKKQRCVARHCAQNNGGHRTAVAIGNKSEIKHQWPFFPRAGFSPLLFSHLFFWRRLLMREYDGNNNGRNNGRNGTNNACKQWMGRMASILQRFHLFLQDGTGTPSCLSAFFFATLWSRLVSGSRHGHWEGKLRLRFVPWLVVHIQLCLLFFFSLPLSVFRNVLPPSRPPPPIIIFARCNR